MEHVMLAAVLFLDVNIAE